MQHSENIALSLNNKYGSVIAKSFQILIHSNLIFRKWQLIIHANASVRCGWTNAQTTQ